MKRSLPLLILIAAVVLVVTTVALGAWLDGDASWTEATAAIGLGAAGSAAGPRAAATTGAGGRLGRTRGRVLLWAWLTLLPV